jgi:RNA recognition motif-containing protein
VRKKAFILGCEIFDKKRSAGDEQKLESRMNIYVGNLSYQTTEDDVRQAFEGYGQVTSVNIIKDKYSGESKGFGFVEMASKDEASEAMNSLNNTELNGRNMNVNEAKPRNDNRGGGGGRRGGGYRDNW